MIAQESLQLGNLRVDLAARKIFINGILLHLRNKEFLLLLYFLNNVGKVMTRTQILEGVWDNNMFCSTNTVDVHVSTLRQKLRPFFPKELIKTVHCVGYILEL